MKHILRFQLLLRIAVLIAACWVLPSFAQTRMDQPEKLKSVLNIIRTFYTDTVDQDKLTEAAIVKMLEMLDPHSHYIPAKDVKRNDEPLVANFDGIGVTFQLLKDTIFVLEVISGGPAEKVGLRAGDKILTINDTSAVGNKVDQNYVVSRLRGPKGTKVRIAVLRKGEQALLEFVITRDKIPIFSVEATYMANAETGYIKLVRFASTSHTELVQAMEKLKAMGMKNLILDLQGNTGGYLTVAAQIANEFLQDKELIVYTEGKNSARENYYANGRGMFLEGKLMVLIDEGSASASEIISGAVQDLDRGLIVGRRTFGKGLVQRPWNLPDGSMIRLTVAHYFTPSGRCIQRPYENGKKDYLDEFSRRMSSGELFGKDTFHFPDSLLFYTKIKRKVYGGGGVFPDHFVPVDTQYNSLFLGAVSRKGMLNNFCLEISDQKRAEYMAAYPDADSYFNRFKPDSNLLKQFVIYTETDSALLTDIYQKGKADTLTADSLTLLRANDLSRSAPLILNMIKALVGRNLFDNNTYHRILNTMNPVFKKATEISGTNAAFEVLYPQENKGKTKRTKK